jgi:hypothetical protein
MSTQLTSKDWAVTGAILALCLIGIPIGTRLFTQNTIKNFQQGISNFAPKIIEEARLAFEPALQTIAETEYNDSRFGSEWLEPKDETVAAVQNGCRVLIEAADRADHRYYSDQHNCAVFFKKAEGWIMVNMDVYKPDVNEFYMENVLKLQASGEQWRIDPFGELTYKVTYKLRSNPDAFVDMMVVKRDYD